MRMLPTHTLVPKPAQVKRQPSQVAHLAPPLKGLNLDTKTTTGDPLTAPILTNFVVENDRITVRGGFRKLRTIAGNPAIWQLIPWYGDIQALLAASSSTLYNVSDGTTIKAGFTSGDWHWTSFTNLSQQDYTVMVNGADGVWSWDGALATGVDYGPVTVTSLSNTNPAKCTVASGDIAKFSNGQLVLIAGATGTGMTNANGLRAISSVNSPVANTFTLTDVDTSTGAAPQTTGVTADPVGTGVVKESVTAPAGEAWVNVNTMNIVVAHMNRLWFADTANLAIFYLPLQSKTGALKVLPLNAYFRRGGTIRAMYTWSLEGGVSIENLLAVFTSNGECALFAGTDPDTVNAFSLKGVFRFDAPMSKHCVVNYGGELYVLIATGLVPMSTLMKAESEQLGEYDKSVVSFFRQHAMQFSDHVGWQVLLNPQSGRMYCNIPNGTTNQYQQMIRDMSRPAWSMFDGVPARCWAWLYPYMWFADDSGNIYQGHTQFLNDDGKPIMVDVQTAWSQFKTPGIKAFKLVQVYYISDGELLPRIDIKVKYDSSPPENQPDITTLQAGVAWDAATWDVDFWAPGPQPNSQWTGVGRMGRVGAIRLTAAIQNCEFSITGFDLTYETGSIL